MSLRQIYNTGTALMTDLYQLTMGQGYFHSGLHERRAVFHLFFRKNPFQGGYTVFSGLTQALDLIDRFTYTQEDIQYLSSLQGADGNPLFANDYLQYLLEMQISLTIAAPEEGRVMFPNQPLLRVEGPLLQCQLVESALLTLVNFQSLIATKAARICAAADGDPVLEFGLRRAQGIDGSLSACYAAFVGGCAATSNVLAGKLYDMPVKGTHAHSWVMAFEDETLAFETYAAAMPNNCIFLVDTYNTIDGVHRAVTVGRKLRDRGHEMLGVRLDSGDLCALSIEARKILDEAGFPHAKIVASNDLDEYAITDLKQRGARIDTWGVGTKLTTAYDQPALGGVYKLSAIEDDQGTLLDRIKLSEEPIKISNPGIQQVRRYFKDGQMVADQLYNQPDGPSTDPVLVNRNNAASPLPDHDRFEDLLKPVMIAGTRQETGNLETARGACRSDLQALPQAYRRLHQPEVFPQGLDRGLADLRMRLIEKAGTQNGI